MSWEFCNIWFKKSFWNHFIFRVANSAGCLAETESAGCLHETSVIRPVFHTEHIIDALPSAPFLSRATLIEHPAANLNDFSVSIQKHSIYNLEIMSTLICCCLFMLYFFSISLCLIRNIHLAVSFVWLLFTVPEWIFYLHAVTPAGVSRDCWSVIVRILKWLWECCWVEISMTETVKIKTIDWLPYDTMHCSPLI